MPTLFEIGQVIHYTLRPLRLETEFPIFGYISRITIKITILMLRFYIRRFSLADVNTGRGCSCLFERWLQTKFTMSDQVISADPFG